MIPRSLLLALAGLGLVLTATVVPGVFTVDEDNYLVTVTGLRQGRLTVPGTEGLTPSAELLYFDPLAPYRRVEATPVASTAPPLYAPLALPFAWLGWRGLVALNTLSFLLALALVYAYAARHARATATPWLAVAALGLGAYCLEYAQGVWPHMLTLALGLGAVVVADRVRDGAPLAAALAAGALASLAAGVRYQNVVLAAGIGLGIVVWAPRRLRAGAAFAAGVAGPLALSSLLNHLRLGFWNPISKGPGYLPRAAGAGGGDFVADALRMAWARVVDFAARPPLAASEHTVYLHRDPATGAYLVESALKKAWLQSAPWIVLALLACAAAWWGAPRPTPGASGRPGGGQRRELRALSLLIFPVLALFAASGVDRTDGLCFNQRYFIELLPLVAVAFAWSLDGLDLKRPWLIGGACAGALAALVAFRLDLVAEPLRRIALLRLPLALAAVAAGTWVLGRAREGRGRRAAAAAAGACLAWGLAVHLGDDVPASRALRQRNHARAAELARGLPERAALFAYWGRKDAAGALQLDRDLVVLDVHIDGGRTFPALVADFQRDARPVFVYAGGFPAPLIRTLLAERPLRQPAGGPPELLELPPPAPAPPPD